MPSLKVSNNANKNTFKHFYSSLTRSFAKNEYNISRNEVTGSIAKLVLTSILITYASFTVSYLWSDILSYHYNNIYEQYHLYFIEIWIIYVIFPFLSLLFINHILLNGYYNYSLKHNVIIAFIVVVLMHGIVITLLVWQDLEYGNSIWDWKWICHKIFIKDMDITPRSKCTAYFTLVNIYADMFSYPLCLFVTIVLNYLVFCLNSKKELVNYDNINGIIDINTSTVEMQAQDLNQSLMNKESSITNESKINVVGNKLSIIKYSFCLYIVLTLLLFIFICEMYLVTTILYFYTKNVDYYFYCLLFSTSSSKILLKFFGKKIDRINMNCYNNNNNNNNNSNSIQLQWYHYISCELFIEFCINFQYFLYYYELFVYELSSKHLSNVFLLIFLHLLSESCQSIIRFSSVYYQLTKKIHSKMEFYYNHIYSDNDHDNRNIMIMNKLCQKTFLFLLKRFEDDSDLNEWRIRHSIDSCIRCISLICAYCLFVILLVILPSTFFNVSRKSDYYTGIFYCCLSFSCDLIYFFFIFVLIIITIIVSMFGNL